MAKPEDVLYKSVKSILDYWKLQKVVISYYDIRRLNLKYIRGRYFSHKQKGTPDILVHLKYKKTCVVLYIELKTENDRIKDDQIKFMLMFKDITNVYYDVVRHPSQIDSRIEGITKYHENIMDNMILPEGDRNG